MRGPALRPVVIAAGGTGGHFFPAEALAGRLVARGHRIVLMTDARSDASNSAVFAGQDQHVLHGAGIAGRSTLRSAGALLDLARGTLQARRLLRAMNAAVVVGFGGYPSVAPVLAAASLQARPRVVLQEQNAVLGRANRFLSRWADLLALGFAETMCVPAGLRIVVTGNPVRPAVAALSGCGYAQADDVFRLLVLGGSLGARVFSDVVPAALARLPKDQRTRLMVAQQCRQEDFARVQAAYAAIGVAAELAPFFADIAGRLGAAHFVIARAGASTCAELAVAARPSLLVPLPGAIDDHQRANARILASTGGAWMIEQADFQAETLASRLRDALSDPATLSARALASASLARPQAADELADVVEQVMQTAGVRA